MRRWLQRMVRTWGPAALRLWVLGVLCAIPAAGVGCKQQYFLSKDCFDQASMTLPPASIETDQCIGDAPLSPPAKTPASLVDPDRPVRHLTLHEAFAIALENGSVSDGVQPGTVNDNLNAVTFIQGSSGFNQQNTDRVRALALNPAIAGANLEAALSKFDAVWNSTVNWTTTDNIQQGLSAFQNGSTGTAATSIVKPTATGGYLATTWSNSVRTLSDVQPGVAITPLAESRLDFGFEQPLWQSYGVDINQILVRNPFGYSGTGAINNTQAAAAVNSRGTLSSILAVGGEGILISRIRVEQQRAEFERRIQNLLNNTEIAYWRLYQAYGRLYSFEEVLRIAHKAWLTNHAKYIAGTIGPANYYPIRGQYEEFRGERMAALGNVLEAERNLRGILGLPIEDGTRLVPIDAPTLAPYQPDWDSSVQMALMQRPELAIARENLRTAQYALVAQKNFLKPDLRAFGRYSPVGFGNRFDGNGSLKDGANIDRDDNALRSLASSEYADWTIGLQLNMPIGFRFEYAAVRNARLNLAQSYYVLADYERRVQFGLEKQYQKLAEWYSLVEARRAERKAYAESVQARFQEFQVGRATVSDFLLEAQRRLATAQVKEYEAIAEYNIALASFEHAKGNVLRHNNIVIAEGPLPECAEVKAVEHEQQRARAHILRERPTPLCPGRLCFNTEGLPDTLVMPANVPLLTDVPVDGSNLGPNGVALPANPPLPVSAAPNTPASGTASGTANGSANVQPGVLPAGTPAFRSVSQPSSLPPTISGSTGLPVTTQPPMRATPRN